MDDLEFEGDLSPITIFLIGCLVSSVLFAVVKRIIESSTTSEKFRRRTRQEEEELLARPARRLIVQPEEEEEFHDDLDAEEENGSDTDNNEAEEDVDEGAIGENANQQMETTTRRMSKKELNKIEKKKKKQERQEAWRHMLDHERRLKELREAEEKEREEFEKQQEMERRKKRENIKPESRKSTPNDDEIFAYLVNHPSKLVRKTDIISNFPNVDAKKLLDQCDRVISRFRTVTIIQLNDDNYFRVDPQDIGRLRARIRSKGHVPMDDLVEELLA